MASPRQMQDVQERGEEAVADVRHCGIPTGTSTAMEMSRQACAWEVDLRRTRELREAYA